MEQARDVDHTPGRPRLVAVPDNVVPLHRHIPNRLRNQWPALSVLALVLLSVVAIAVDFRLSVGILALAVALAFGLRLALPKSRIGWLEVRRKHTDLICLGLLLLGVVLVAVATPA